MIKLGREIKRTPRCSSLVLVGGGRKMSFFPMMLGETIKPKTSTRCKRRPTPKFPLSRQDVH